MSFRARLLALVLLAAVLPATTMVWLFVHDSNSEISRAKSILAKEAADIIARLEQDVQATAQLEFGLSQADLLEGKDPVECSALLAAVREEYDRYTGLVTVRPDGKLWCDSLQSRRNLDLSDRWYFREAVSGKQTLIVGPTTGRLTGRSVLQIVRAVRHPDKSLRYLVVASLDLTRFAGTTQRRMHTDAALILVDVDGRVMAAAGPGSDSYRTGSTIRDAELGRLLGSAESSEVAEVHASNGETFVWSGATGPNLGGLHVLLGMPEAALTADAREHMSMGLLLTAVATLLLFGGAWQLTDKGIHRPLQQISKVVTAVKRGDLTARIERPHPKGEIGDLMKLINRMARSLERQRAAIRRLSTRLRSAHEREISDRAENEARLTRLANSDALTGMANRGAFRAHLEHALQRARKSGRHVGLLFLDLDRFKRINDRFGHEGGDRLLIDVSLAISQCIRSADTVQRTPANGVLEQLFRLGGDEFTILLEDLSGTESIGSIAQRILLSLRRPILIGSHEVFISASIGGAVSQLGNEGADELIRQADAAMYHSKASGGDTFTLFDQSMAEEAESRVLLESELRHALERNEFELHYQPKADLRTGRVTGVEALLRWKPEGKPMRNPNSFIPVLEETGMIVEVGDWVLRAACNEVTRWQGLGLPALTVAVNLSGRQFRDNRLLDRIRTVLADTGMNPALLEVELTESMLIDDSEFIMSVLKDLKLLGVRIAVDDFGTGYSSLSYLKRFNLDTLKIDRSFVSDLPKSAEDSAIAVAVISLGRSLGLKVVAEGVETFEQEQFLRERGCDLMQGFGLGKPMQSSTFVEWFNTRESRSVMAEAMSTC